MLTKFRDIPRFIRDGNYQCNQDLGGLIPYIDSLTSKLGLNIDPDFQRAHVWTKQQQINYLEYFLRAGKSGRELYFNHPGWMRDYKGEFVLVDGKQRIEAVRRFINNELPVFGFLFRDFSDSPDIVDHSFIIRVNSLQTRREVLEWYLQMNSGGTPHSEDDLNKVRKLLQSEK